MKMLEPPEEHRLAREWESPMDIPINRREAYRVYGNPGVGKVDKNWEHRNMVVARDLPGPRSKLYVHKLAEPFLREALAVCEIEGCTDYITKLGCWNFRHQRHDSSRPLSYHAFGIAIDINPRQNKAWYRTEKFDKDRRRGPVPKPFEGEWYKFWPDGVPQALVSAFEAIGWNWGGRWQRYVDPMHFELVGPPAKRLLP